MSKRFIQAPLCALTAVSMALLPACGGGGSSSAPSLPVVSTFTTAPVPTPAPASTATVNVALLPAGSASVPSAVVTTSTGDSVSYYGAASLATPTEAFVKSGNSASWVYYNADGSINRMLDVTTGSYVVVRARQDKLGAEYLTFDNANTFVSGTTVYQDAGTWFQAPILGDMGQITATLTAPAVSGTATGPSAAPLSGAISLRATQLAYGAPVGLPTGAQALLNGQLTTASLGGRLLDMLVPSAYAQSVLSTQDRARLYSGVALSVVGGVVFASNPVVSTLFLAAGAATAYRTLTNFQDKNLSQVFLDMDKLLEGGTSASYSNTSTASSSLLERVRASIEMAVKSGLTVLRANLTRTITQSTSLSTGVTPTTRLTDPTPASYTLPVQPLRGTPVNGSVVDATGRVFTATGTVSSTGTIDVTATTTDGESLTVTGTVTNSGTNATGTVTGSVTRYFGGRSSLGTLTAGTTAAVGKCQTLTQSGGQGTFSYAFNLGRSAGSFQLNYEMYSIPDGMTIVVGGKTVFSTNGLVSGAKSVTVPFADSDTAFVNMYAPNSGTAWDFTLGCGT